MNQQDPSWSSANNSLALTPTTPNDPSPYHTGGVIAHAPSLESQGSYHQREQGHIVAHHPSSVLVSNNNAHSSNNYPNQQQIPAYQSSAENFPSLPSAGSSGAPDYSPYYRSNSSIQSPQEGNIFFPPPTTFNPYSNLGPAASWPYTFPYNELEQYHYNQADSLTDLLNPIRTTFDMPTSRAGMVISNYGGAAAYTMASTKKRTGGRRPKEEEEMLSAEEMEKRKLRRVRNKEAAARCRQRRLNHMQALQAQVDALAAENQDKQKEIETLQQEKDELVQILHSHNCTMKNGGTKPSYMSTMRRLPSLGHFKSATPPPQMVKIEPLDPTLTQVVTVADTEGYNTPTSTGLNLSRPSSLPFDTPNTPGVPIQTPTAGFGGFDLLGQSTGLTPVTNTGLTPILTLGGGMVTCGNSLSLETPTGMDTSAGIPVKISTTLQNL